MAILMFFKGVEMEYTKFLFSILLQVLETKFLFSFCLLHILILLKLQFDLLEWALEEGP